MWSPTSPITGAAQTGLTSPTYSFVADTAPDSNGKQVAITALGGTQTGVTTHSGGAPFTVTFAKPKQYKSLGKANLQTGVVGSVPRNTYKLITRKSVIPMAGQPPTVMMVTTTIEVPAGADTYDAPNVHAGVSAHLGALAENSVGLGDTVVSNII